MFNYDCEFLESPKGIKPQDRFTAMRSQNSKMMKIESSMPSLEVTRK